MSNVRFDELELMLMAMFEQPTLKDTIQVLKEVQPLELLLIQLLHLGDSLLDKRSHLCILC